MFVDSESFSMYLIGWLALLVCIACVILLPHIISVCLKNIIKRSQKTTTIGKISEKIIPAIILVVTVLLAMIPVIAALFPYTYHD
jgi:TRAP-type C4-dicarboxylate transport system permease small subunit